MFFPRLGPIWLLYDFLGLIRDESLTFGQTPQLGLEMRLICSNYIYNYITLLPALENHVPPRGGPLGSYKA